MAGYKFRKGNKSTLGMRGEKANAWKGGKLTNKGKVLIHRPCHPKAIKTNYVAEHILKAEKALGKFLPDGAVVHHFDGDSMNNKNNNLIICESQAYHLFLHMRTRAYMATGDPNKLKCRICKNFDDPSNLYVTHKNNGNFKSIRHKECHRLKEKNRNETKKAKG